MKDERSAPVRSMDEFRRATPETGRTIAAIRDALYASKICSYAQGMSLIAAGAREWNWQINLREIARIWNGGCIIRALLLDPIMRAFERQPALPNLLLDANFQSRITAALRPGARSSVWPCARNSHAGLSARRLL